MGEISGALKTSIGMKILMALSGIGLVGFVIIHMAGNLQMFIGQDAMNTYAATLKKYPLFLWTARLGLFGIFMIHIVDGIRLKLQNKAARPVQYAKKDTVQATIASRTMALTGILIFGFVVYHLLHFTLGVTNPDHFQLEDALGRHDVYSMVVEGFSNIYISGFYIVMMLLLSLHLSHGASSFFQSLGFNSSRWYYLTKKIGPIVSFIVVAGFIAVPLGVILGIIKPVGDM